MFRYERPQAGRLREFQLGVECLIKNPATDVETIAMAYQLYCCRHQGSYLHLNSLGNTKSRLVIGQAFD